MGTIKVGIIGCGRWSPYHIRALSQFPDVRIKAVCSRNNANAKESVRLIREVCPEQCGQPVAVYADYAEMVRDADIDAVTVCTPPPVHAGPMIVAANAGKHVFCEGPMAVDLDQCDRMIAAASANNVKFTVQHTNRFSRNALMAKKALTDGLLGRVLMARMEFLVPAAGEGYIEQMKGNWRSTRSGCGGGVIFHDARYAIDTLMWLLGDAREVYARVECFVDEGIEVEDSAVATISFRNGALGQIFASRLAQPGMIPSPFYRIEILGSKASIAVLPEWSMNSYDESYAREVNDQLGSNEWSLDGGWETQLRDWVDAIKLGRTPVFPAEEFRSQVEFAQAIYQSAESGKPVLLPLPPGDS